MGKSTINGDFPISFWYVYQRVKCGNISQNHFFLPRRIFHHQPFGLHPDRWIPTTFRAPSEDIPLQAPAKSIAPDEGNMKTLMFDTQKQRISLYLVISCYISLFCKWIMWSMWWSFGSLKTCSFLNCSLSASFWSFCPFLFSDVELYHQNPAIVFPTWAERSRRRPVIVNRAKNAKLVYSMGVFPGCADHPKMAKQHSPWNGCRSRGMIHPTCPTTAQSTIQNSYDMRQGSLGCWFRMFGALKMGSDGDNFLRPTQNLNSTNHERERESLRFSFRDMLW